MRVYLTMTLLAIGLAAVGCQSQKRPPAPAAPSANIPNPNRPFWDQGDQKRSPTLNTPSAGARPNGDGVKLAGADSPDVNGVLAGMLVDSMGRRPKQAYIQVQALSGQDVGRPVEVAADENGYFVITNLTPGKPYVLTARTQETGKMLAGRVQTMPPQTRLTIQLREDLASADIPGLPAHPGDLLPGNNNNRNTAGPSRPAAPPLPLPPNTNIRRDADNGWSPGAATPFGPPESPNIPAPSAPIPGGRENIAGAPKSNPPPPPLVNVPGAPAPPPGPDLDPVPMPGGSSMLRRPPTAGPICEISGQKVMKLSMAELDGPVWDFQTHHGELILLDFWGSWCQPCLKAIPHLKDLQRRYGAYGLEVIGVACESDTGEERDQNLRAVRQRLGINYPILLAEEKSRCPVQRRFGIRAYPTLILLDKNGFVLARADGANFTQIDAVIQQRLGRR